MAKEITNDRLKPGTLVLTSGKVAYSHIGSLISGDELKADNERREAMNIAIINRPYTTLTLYDSKVIPKGTEMNLEEQYVNERIYQSTSEKYTDNCLSLINKTESLPNLYRIEGSTMIQLPNNGQELKRNQEVMAFLRVFESENGIGVALESIASREGFKFMISNKSGYEDFGFDFEDSASEDEKDPPFPV